MDTEIVENKDFIRSGVIPYFTLEMKRYYFMFIDRKYGGLIDGGGHIEVGENFISCAVRELSEESLNIFNYSYEDLRTKSLCYYDKNTIVLFPEVEINSLKEALSYCVQFRESYLDCERKGNCKKESIENSYLIYISEGELLSVLHGDDVEMNNELVELFAKNPTVPTKNSKLALEFRQGLLYYPSPYHVISNLIENFILSL